MKSRYKAALLAVTGAALFANPAPGAVSLESGNLAIAFYQVTPGSGGGTVGSNTYVYNLGAASLYRENTGYNVSVSTVNSGIASSNINADLTSAFGSNWANGGTVRWMIVGNVGQTAPTVGGDPALSSYFSQARNDFSVQTTFPNLSSSSRFGVGNSIKSFMDGTTNKPSAGNADGTIIATSTLHSVDEYVSPTTLGLYFTLGANPTQTLASGTINGPEGQAFEGALDIYRVLHTTAGADLTASYASGDAVVGQGQYIGTVTLDSLGNLGVIPEPSTALLGVLGAAGACFRRRRNA